MSTRILFCTLFLALISTSIKPSSASLETMFTSANKTLDSLKPESNTVQESSGPLKNGFYKESCPNAEAIVKKVVEGVIQKDPSSGAGLIKLQFHDCFVRGCDASNLIDSNNVNQSEKHEAQNPRGYAVIDLAKEELEAACPETVSCADIIAFAARDSANFLGGIDYKVQSGRRDGRISRKEDADANLLSPDSDLKQLEKAFVQRGLTLEELVVLSGAHSVGVAHCSNFVKRLYSFREPEPKQDPSLDLAYATELKAKCQIHNYKDIVAETFLPLDFLTPNKLDNLYYRDVQQNKVLLSSDQALMDDQKSANLVKNLARLGAAADWGHKFGKAMVRMGAIEVLTGKEGEIRKKCRKFN